MISAFTKYGNGFVSLRDQRSGISIRLEVESDRTQESLCEDAEKLKLHIAPVYVPAKADTGVKKLIFYYDQIPLNEIDEAVKDVCTAWSQK